MLVVLVDTLSLVVLSWEPLTASVLPAVRSPAVTLVILLVASVPCLALNAVPFQSRASFSRVSTSAFRVVILLAFVAISAVLVAISVVLVAILAVLSAILAVLVAISVVLVAISAVLSAILAVLVAISVVLVAILAVLVAISVVLSAILAVLVAISAVLSAILAVLVATSSLVSFNWEPLTASLLVSEIVPSSTLVILLVASVPCAALNAVPFHNSASCCRSYN